MNRANIARLDQWTESPLTATRGPTFGYRYAYTPSADSLRDHEPGQDYLVFNDQGSTFIFAACDGVSQSFYGNLAARLLGEELVAWLAGYAPAPGDALPSAADLSAFLLSLTGAATAQVDEQLIPTEPPVLYSILLEKRARGSEAMFVCGRVDLEAPDGSAGRIFLAWMGDMRVGLWRANRRVDLGGRHETDERWSSRRGPIGGDVHVYSGPLTAEEPFSRLIVYSDGLKALDETPDWRQTDDSLRRLISGTSADPESDDVTYFELGVIPPSPARPARPLPDAPPPPPPQNRTAQTNTRPVAAGSIPAKPKARRKGVMVYALLGGMLISLFAVVWLAVSIPFGALVPSITGGEKGLPPMPTPAPTANSSPAQLPAAPPANTPAVTPTNTPTATPTSTLTAAPTSSSTVTPTSTSTVTPTSTPAATPTSTSGNAAIEAVLNQPDIKTG